METLISHLTHLERQLTELEQLPVKLSEGAHAVIEEEMPVYTGTYQDAVQTGGGPGQAFVQVTGASLKASAWRHSDEIKEVSGMAPGAYITVKAGFAPGDELYPLRVEQRGTPAGRAQGMWFKAYKAAERVVRTAVERFRTLK